MIESFYNEEMFLNLIELTFGLVIIIAVIKRTQGFKYLNIGKLMLISSGLLIIIKESISLSGIINGLFNEVMTALVYLCFAAGISLFFKREVFRKYLEQLRTKKGGDGREQPIN